MEKCSKCGRELGEGYTKLLGWAICANCLISPESEAMHHRCFVCSQMIQGADGRRIGNNVFAHVGNFRFPGTDDLRDCYNVAVDEGVVTDPGAVVAA